MDYFDMLDNLSKKWMSVHLTHNVSLTATYEFWKLAMKTIPKLMDVKKRQDIQRKTPQLVHLRRKIYQELCPEVHLNFIYLRTSTNETIKANSKTTPIKQFQSDPDYIKQCESAHIKVNE